MSEARVIFMCGPSGSGKSTYARRLEAEGMERLSFDVEAWRRGVTEVPAPVEVLTEIEAELKTRLLDLVAQGRDVVLDFPFSTRSMRQDYRDLLASVGVVPETVYLATDAETIAQRLTTRAAVHADDLVIDDAVLTAHLEGFEPPTPEEGPLIIVR